MGILKKIKTHTFPSFTLIESVMAIIITMACFFLSTTIYINILRSDARIEHLKAFTEGKQKIISTKQNRLYFDEESSIQNLHIKKSITPYQGGATLRILHIEVFNEKNRKITSHKQIIVAE